MPIQYLTPGAYVIAASIISTKSRKVNIDCSGTLTKIQRSSTSQLLFNETFHFSSALAPKVLSRSDFNFTILNSKTYQSISFFSDNHSVISSKFQFGPHQPPGSASPYPPFKGDLVAAVKRQKTSEGFSISIF